MTRTLPLLLVLFAACEGEFGLQGQDKDKVPVAKPPDDDDNDVGDPPDWVNCFSGFVGEYSNIAWTHPDMEPDPEATPPQTWDDLDWWDDVAFSKFDPNIDMGGNWWPVDEDLQEDPKYFGVRWNAWMRVFSNTTLEYSFGSAGDAWIVYDGEPLDSLPGVKPFVTESHTVQLNAGQAPIEIRYAHRGGDSGFRFRVTDGDVKICYAEYQKDLPTEDESD